MVWQLSYLRVVVFDQVSYCVDPVGDLDSSVSEMLWRNLWNKVH